MYETLTDTSKAILSITQDAREAMRVVFFVLTKRICLHKTKFRMNIFKYCFKNYIKLHEFANCNSANYDVYFLTIMIKIVIPWINLIMLQLQVDFLKKSSISDMQHRKTYNYFNFQQNWVSRSVKTVHTNVFAKIIRCIDLQIPIVFSKKSIISDKHHRITYMYINF